ncbi:MAG: Trk system potassium transporter TrkA [Gammaproteobacteria bacterium]|nr:Trk system potassium transporter TrkA [Gammaproteobacteria bacterium]
MKIIIIGAGQVGATLAENLVGEKNDITVIDHSLPRLQQLKDKLDLKVVLGQGSHPSTLRNAGAEDAEMLIAVTDSDETNMIACQVASTLFNTPTKIARIRSQEYLGYKAQLFHSQEIPVDHFIAPEQLVTQYISNLIEYPGALQVVEFADGKVSLVAVKAYYGGPLVGNALSTLKDHMPDVETRVAAIFRRGKAIRPQGTTIIEADDEVFFVADTRHIRSVMAELQRLESDYKRIIIVGGGNIGLGLAKALERDHQVKLIERDADRANRLARELSHATVFCGDASDQELLLEEHIGETDLFIAVTNNDEANIMSALLAKRLGVGKTMVLIQRTIYAELVQGGQIDIAISPQQATVSTLLSRVRRGDMVNVYSLRRGAAEAIEAIAHGDATTSRVVGRTVGELKLPPGATIGAIVRGDEVLIAHDSTRIDSNDHVILFLIDKRHIGDIEKLFQPSAFFF